MKIYQCKVFFFNFVGNNYNDYRYLGTYNIIIYCEWYVINSMLNIITILYTLYNALLIIIYISYTICM